MPANQLYDECVIITTNNETTGENANRSYPEGMAAKPPATPQRDLRHILFAAQFFGMLPVEGVLSGDARDLRFRWCSPRVFYTLLLTAPTFLLTAMAFYRISKEEEDTVSMFSKLIET